MAPLHTTNFSKDGYDLVLSSGFLAFAAHCGFLQACVDEGVPVRGIMGTSAGALIGSMFAAGYSPREIADEFSRLPPIQRVAPCFSPWEGGVLSLHPVVNTLKELLPPDFEALNGKFGCAVVDKKGQHVLVEQGGLPEAVTASAAVPILFAKVDIPKVEDGPFMDGGMRCRIGLDLWRENKYGSETPKPAIIHLIGRSSPFSGNDDTSAFKETRDITLVYSPKSGASLWDLNDFDRQFELARQRALPVLKEMRLKEGKMAVAAGGR